MTLGIYVVYNLHIRQYVYMHTYQQLKNYRWRIKKKVKGIYGKVWTRRRKGEMKGRIIFNNFLKKPKKTILIAAVWLTACDQTQMQNLFQCSGAGNVASFPTGISMRQAGHQLRPFHSSAINRPWDKGLTAGSRPASDQVVALVWGSSLDHNPSSSA